MHKCRMKEQAGFSRASCPPPSTSHPPFVLCRRCVLPSCRHATRVWYSIFTGGGAPVKHRWKYFTVTPAKFRFISGITSVKNFNFKAKIPLKRPIILSFTREFKGEENSMFIFLFHWWIHRCNIGVVKSCNTEPYMPPPETHAGMYSFPQIP